MNILGKGVDAIEVNSITFGQDFKSTDSIQTITLDKIVKANYQPRKNGKITKESIAELVTSIKKHGVLQPILVRRIANERYEIIAGERRYCSAIEANLNDIPCVIKNVNVKDAFALALIENIQREQLTLLELSESLLKLKDDHCLTVDDVSKLIGKPRSTVANLIRAASLTTQEGKLLWEKKLLDYGHIRAAIVLENKYQNIVLNHVVDKKLSVRDTERLIRSKKYLSLESKTEGSNPEKSIISSEEIKMITNKFSAKYSKDVKIKPLISGKIRISIEFENLEKTYDYLNEF